MNNTDTTTQERTIKEEDIDSTTISAVSGKYRKDCQEAHDEAVAYLVETEGITEQEAEQHDLMEKLFEEILDEKRPDVASPKEKGNHMTVESVDPNTRKPVAPNMNKPRVKRPRERIRPVIQRENNHAPQDTFEETEHAPENNTEHLVYLTNVISQEGYPVHGCSLDNVNGTVTFVIGV